MQVRSRKGKWGEADKLGMMARQPARSRLRYCDTASAVGPGRAVRELVAVE